MIEPTTDKEQIKEIITEPKLWAMTYGQGCLIEQFEVDLNNYYYSIIHDKQVIGLFETKPFNKITLDAHIYILPKYQDGQLSVKAVKAGQEYFKENTDIHNIITTVPVSCSYVHRFLSKTDFKATGQISDGIIYNDQLQNLIIYQLKIRG